MSEFWEEAWRGLGAAKGPPRPSYKPSLLPLLSLSPRSWPISDQRQLGAGVWLGAWGDPWGPAWASLAHHLCLCLTVNSPLREGRVRPSQGSEAEAETWTSRSGQGHGAAAAWGPLALPSEEAEAGRDRATEEQPQGRGLEWGSWEGQGHRLPSSPGAEVGGRCPPVPRGPAGGTDPWRRQEGSRQLGVRGWQRGGAEGGSWLPEASFASKTDRQTAVQRRPRGAQLLW